MSKSSKKSKLPSKPQGLDKVQLSTVEGLFDESQESGLLTLGQKPSKKSLKRAKKLASNMVSDPLVKEALVLGQRASDKLSKKALKKAKKISKTQVETAQQDASCAHASEPHDGGVSADEPVAPQDALLEAVIGKGPSVMSKKRKIAKRTLKSKGKVLPIWPSNERPFTDFVHSVSSRVEATLANAPHDLCVTFSEIPLMYAFHVATDHEQVNHLFSKNTGVTNGVAFFVKVGYRAAILIGVVHPDIPLNATGEGLPYQKIIFNLDDPVVVCNLNIQYSLAL